MCMAMWEAGPLAIWAWAQETGAVLRARHNPVVRELHCVFPQGFEAH